MEYKQTIKYNEAEGSEELVRFRPRASSIELAVESYSAMRYHGQ